MDQIEDKVRLVTQDYKELENLRDNIIAELKNVSNDTLLRVSNDTLLRVEKLSAGVGGTKLEETVEKIRKDTGMDEPEEFSPEAETIEEEVASKDGISELTCCIKQLSINQVSVGF